MYFNITNLQQFTGSYGCQNFRDSYADIIDSAAKNVILYIIVLL